MSKIFPSLTPKLIGFIEHQRIFFVGTAAETGTVNVSPKGSDSFRVINKNTCVWLNLTGSGNETAAHLLKNNRMTVMFCSFNDKPLILRLYAKASIYHENDDDFKEYSSLFSKNIGARQIIKMQINQAQTSCGFAVPLMDFKAERNMLDDWSENKGREGIKEYWATKNTKSIDGFDTEILNNEASE